MSLIKKNRNAFPTMPALFDDFLGRELFNWGNTNYSFTQTTIPMVNIRESAENFEVEVAAPGMDKKDFRVQLEDNTLTISSQKEKAEETEHNGYNRREFSYESFQRSFTLPRDVVDEQAISAQYENGILHLTIPKREEARHKGSRLIEIA
jgi:HSP20 family protein